MRTVEASGKTVEEAKKKAAAQLGVPEADLEFEVLEIGTKGILGFLGGVPARIRATYYESRRQRQADQDSSFEASRYSDVADSSRGWDRGKGRTRRGQGGRTEPGGRQEMEQKKEAGSTGGPPPRKQASGDRRKRPDGTSQRQSGQDKRLADKSQDQAPSRPAERPAERSGSGRRSSGRTRQSGAERSTQKAGAESRSSISKISGSQPSSKKSVASERPAQAESRSTGGQANMETRSKEAVALVQRLLDAGRLDATARAVDLADDGFEIAIEGGQSSLLTGKQGQTLDALQFLVGIMVNRTQEKKVRVTLEADGYRRKHRETLEKTALDLAEQVKEHNQEAELEPLPARDRLIIHQVLKDHPYVYTYSEGEGDQRHVVISPREEQEAG